MKLYKIIYGKKYINLVVDRHLRHCVILKVASGRPRNCLVKLRGNELVVVPYGNLRFVGYLKKGGK